MSDLDARKYPEESVDYLLRVVANEAIYLLGLKSTRAPFLRRAVERLRRVVDGQS